MHVTVLLLAALLSLAPAGARAQSFAVQGADQYFRVEWSAAQGRRGPIVTGYVYNTYGQTADRVWLMIEALDATGRVTATRHERLLGTIPNGDRTYFEAPAPAGGTTYRVRVTTYEWVGRGA